MPAFVYFSAVADHYLLVQEDPGQIANAIETASSHLIKLTHISSRGERGFEKPVWVTVSRIAYVTGPADPSRVPASP